ncbi:MAG: hypothetical protein O3B24_04560 [Verrucomicrobia bacterium]|nr:hypothetical protein [Verrucomicrobiota bacterium]
MKRTGIVSFAVALCVGTALNIASAEDAHAHHGHDLSGPELGVSIGYVHLLEEEEDALGIHAHLMQRLGGDGIQQHLAVGVGAEYLFSDEEHYALMLSLAVYPWRGLVLSVSPGIQWAEHEGETEAEYSTHLEATYVFTAGEYDFGPVVDYSWTADEAHYMIGLHLGIHF